MSVEIATAAPPDWDGFIAEQRASSYHRAAAVAIGEKAFKLRTHYLTVRDEQRRLRGALPLVEQSSLFFGRFLVSLPFFTYGGMVAADPEASELLIARAIELARERRADHIELRHSVAHETAALSVRLDKVSMVLDLPRSAEELSKKLGAKLRSQIRRSDREKPEVVWGGPELLGEFYPVFAASMHLLGTPVYPRSFFEIVCEALRDCVAVLVIRVGTGVQAAAITVRHGSSIEVPWAAATPAAKSNAVNMRMYWEMLAAAIEAGAESFDYGRCTPGSGTHRFKAQWGAQPRQLYWHRWTHNGAPAPILNHANPKYALAGAMWRRMPLWCANLIGPQIVRHLP